MAIAGSHRKCPATSERKICVHHAGPPIGVDLEPSQLCKGDSGGPLILKHEGMGVLIGVASYQQMPDCPPDNITCIMIKLLKCNKDDVGVFTKVQAFLPWIKKISGVGEYHPFLKI